jgi:hypothetical protein
MSSLLEARLKKLDRAEAAACRDAARIVADASRGHPDTITPTVSDAVDDALLTLARAADAAEADR